MLSKEKIIAACNAYIAKQIATIDEALLQARQAGNDDTKSSAGDKFETTRAMMHFEQEKLSGQLAETLKLREAIFNAEKTKTTDQIGLGSLVKTTLGIYFIAAGLGKVLVGNEVVFVISSASPIGQKLHGKHVGDEITFNKVSQKILAVF